MESNHHSSNPMMELEESEAAAEQAGQTATTPSCKDTVKNTSSNQQQKQSDASKDTSKSEEGALSPDILKKNVSIVCENSHLSTSRAVVTSGSETLTLASQPFSAFAINSFQQSEAAGNVKAELNPAASSSNTAVSSAGYEDQAACASPEIPDRGSEQDADAEGDTSVSRGTNSSSYTLQSDVPDHPQAYQDKHLNGAALHGVAAYQATVGWMRNAAVARDLRSSAFEQQLLIDVTDDDGAVDLRRAREVRGWNSVCLVCRDNWAQVTVVPCRHEVLCRDCFMDSLAVSGGQLCPLCRQTIEGLAFSRALRDFLIRRSNMM